MKRIGDKYCETFSMQELIQEPNFDARLEEALDDVSLFK